MNGSNGKLMESNDYAIIILTLNIEPSIGSPLSMLAL